jgi:hypothetical protein
LGATSVDDFKKKLDRLQQFQFGCFDFNVDCPVILIITTEIINNIKNKLDLN